jgi:nucleotide-binding universal stress UspA family protein
MRLLFAYDGSEPARRALAYARHLDVDGAVRVISVAAALVEAPHTEAYTDPTQDPAEAHKRLEEARELLRAEGVEAETLLATGNPAAEIIAAAEQHGIELIVVGRRGQHALERFLLGSISERLVRHAPCDVLVVR